MVPSSGDTTWLTDIPSGGETGQPEPVPRKKWCKPSRSRPQTQTLSLIYQLRPPLYRSRKQVRSHSPALRTRGTSCVREVQLVSHTVWPLRCAWWEQPLVSPRSSRRALVGTRQIQGECRTSRRVGDCKWVLRPWSAVGTAIPVFPTPRRGSACAGERQKFMAGMFMCCFPGPRRLMAAQRLSAFRDIFWHLS